MMRNLILLLVLLMFSCSNDKPQENTEAPAQAAPAVQGEAVDYSADGVTLKGYLAYDKNLSGKRPGVLVVHEWWGHNDYARKRADMLAALGYTALAVDMYGDGKQAGHPDDAMKFANEVFSNLPTAEARFQAAMNLLKNHPMTDPEHIAAIGYCFGGGVVLHMARTGIDLDGVVSFHGSLASTHSAAPGSIKAKILVCNGAADGFVTAEQIEAFKKEMDASGADYEFINYEGAVHAFTNPDADVNGEKFGLPLAYNKAADEQSWQAMQDFFRDIFAAN